MEVRVGVSACLLGQNVRYDGGHKRCRFITDELAELVELTPVCPEVEVGMPTPRETIRLVRGEGPDEVRLIAPASGTDHTASMQAWAEKRVGELKELGLDGYVLKSGSPSCGLERVRLYDDHGAQRVGVGRFAAALKERWPELPLEEEGRLNDDFLRECFLTRVFAHARLRALLAPPRLSMGDLVRFHSAEKLLLLAHAPEVYRSLGRLVATGKPLGMKELARRYRREFLEALARGTTRGRHVNVCQHMIGYFKELSPEGRAGLHESLADYHEGLTPLAVPMALIRHHAREHGVDYLLQQTYLEPAPKTLKLRTRVI